MSRTPLETDQDWADRELYWRSKLRRLRFGVEPIGVQVERYRMVTIVLSCVSAGIGLMFLLIFGAFRRLDIGLVLDACLIGPIIGVAWLDYRKLAGRAAAYEAERKEVEKKTP